MPFINAITYRRTSAAAFGGSFTVAREQVSICDLVITLSAYVIGDLTNHAVLWEQIDGAPVVFLDPPNQTTVMFSQIAVKDDKTFRFWIDKGTPYAQYRDMILSSTPRDVHGGMGISRMQGIVTEPYGFQSEGGAMSNALPDQIVTSIRTAPAVSGKTEGNLGSYTVDSINYLPDNTYTETASINPSSGLVPYTPVITISGGIARGTITIVSSGGTTSSARLDSSGQAAVTIAPITSSTTITMTFGQTGHVIVIPITVDSGTATAPAIVVAPTTSAIVPIESGVSLLWSPPTNSGSIASYDVLENIAGQYVQMQNFPATNGTVAQSEFAFINTDVNKNTRYRIRSNIQTGFVKSSISTNGFTFNNDKIAQVAEYFGSMGTGRSVSMPGFEVRMTTLQTNSPEDSPATLSLGRTYASVTQYTAFLGYTIEETPAMLSLGRTKVALTVSGGTSIGS